METQSSPKSNLPFAVGFSGPSHASYQDHSAQNGFLLQGVAQAEPDAATTVLPRAEQAY